MQTATRQQEFEALILDLLPAQGEWDAEGYLWLTDRTNRLIEFAQGAIEELAMPTEQHQTLLLFLYDYLRSFFKSRGKIVIAPMRLLVGGGRFREPDLMLLLDGNDRRRGNRYWTGADLVIEVVSPDDPKRDLVTKRREYAQAGIPEYWIVNPSDETITVLTLRDGSYAAHGVFARGQQATSPLIPGLSVAVSATFDAR